MPCTLRLAYLTLRGRPRYALGGHPGRLPTRLRYLTLIQGKSSWPATLPIREAPRCRGYAIVARDRSATRRCDISTSSAVSPTVTGSSHDTFETRARPPRNNRGARPNQRHGGPHPLSPCAMKPRISLLTLGVDDLERALAFYRDGLGLSTPGIVGTEFEQGAVAFFDLENGLKLALWERRSIAHDTGLPVGPHSATELTIGHLVASKAAVDAVMAQARRAGARIVKNAADTFWGGYSGYFQDPDGHLWEIAWNPQWPVQD